MIKAFVEIKNRIILMIITVLSAFLTAYYYKTFLLILIIVSNMKLSNDVLNYFIFTSITELFSIYLILCLSLTGQILYYIILYHIICFSSPGLYKIEYNNLKLVFVLVISLGTISLYFFYKILIPILSDFFLSFQNYSLKTISFYFEAKIYDYLIFYKDLYSSCFFSFQSCTILILLSNYVSNNLELLKVFRKFFYLIFLLFSTVVTPPEIFSQLFLFTSLILSFEMLVFLNLFKIISFNFNLVNN